MHAFATFCNAFVGTSISENNANVMAATTAVHCSNRGEYHGEKRANTQEAKSPK